MPIRVQCQCGQSLNVPDNLAGKSGKCPKCSSVIKIPAAGTPTGGAAAKPATQASPPQAKQTPSKPAQGKPPQAKAAQPKPAVAKQATPAPAAAAPGGFADFLDEAGLTKKTGKFCPNCDSTVPPGANLCVKCGFHLETGQKLASHEIKLEHEEFGNASLNEAAQMMKREAATQARTLNSGVPWWVLLNVLLGAVVIAGVGIIIVDGNVTSRQPRDSLAGFIQRAPYLYVLMVVLYCIFALTQTFAHFAIVFAAFRDKVGHGLGCLFVPLYSQIYGIFLFKRMRGPVLALWICSVAVIPIAVYLQLNVPQIPADPAK